VDGVDDKCCCQVVDQDIDCNQRFMENLTQFNLNLRASTMAYDFKREN
jgi:hypothetical protein